MDTEQAKAYSQRQRQYRQTQVWKQNHPDKIKEYNKKSNAGYYTNHKEHCQELWKIWKEKNKESLNTKVKEKAETIKRKNKIFLIDYKGGKCIICGYNKCQEALVFHHREPKEKAFDISMLMRRGNCLELLIAEADKCDLLCANCHMEKHAEERKNGK